MIVHGRVPHNAEPQLDRLIENWITPNELFYVRSHAPVPKISVDDFTLVVEGMVQKRLTISLDQLRKIVAGLEKEEARAIVDRVTQFKEETRSIIPSAVAALKAGDIEEFGRQVDRSQEFSDSMLGNIVPETRFLAKSARRLGALASSAFGAGFGGSVWALAPRSQADSIMRDWMADYGQSFPDRIRHSRFFVDPTGPGAFVIGAPADDLFLQPKF